jgi:hypothetical protein
LLAAALVFFPVSTGLAQIVLVGRAGLMDRRLSDGGVVEHQGGVVAGAGLTLRRGPIALELIVSGGNATAKTAGTPDVDFSGVVAEASLSLTSWASITAGAAGSVYVSPLGSQRWILPRLGARLDLPFAGFPGLVYVAGAAIVGGSTNAATGSSGGLTVRAGVQAGRGRAAFFGEYQLERLELPASSGRLEQRGEAVGGMRLRL